MGQALDGNRIRNGRTARAKHGPDGGLAARAEAGCGGHQAEPGAGERDAYLADGAPTIVFVTYNVVALVVSALALIVLLAQPTYLTSAQLAAEGAFNGMERDSLLVVLLTMLAAGGAGGALCNLLGIFNSYRDEGGIGKQYVVPFYIRPFMGAAVGLFVFFVGTMLSGTLSGGATDAAMLGWVTFAGRMPFVALAIVAGFGSQEFMRRLKKVAKTAFADTREEPAGGGVAASPIREEEPAAV